MTLPKPDPSLPTRSERLQLSLPITTNHFRSLAKAQQHDLIAEQVLDWVPCDLEIECSQDTPGAEWVHGSEYYAVVSAVMLPPDIADQEEDDILEWLESYGSQDWTTDIGAAMKLFEPVELLKPSVYKATPNETIPWEWCCHIHEPLTGKAFCWNGCIEFKDLPGAIAITCLEAIGVVSNE